MFKGKVRGFAEIQARLKQLPAKVGQEQIEKALKSAAKPVVETARGLAPRRFKDVESGGRETLRKFVQSPLVKRRIAEGVRVTQLTGKSKAELRAIATTKSEPHLADNIKAYTLEPKDGKVRVVVGYPKRFFYGHFLEWGTVKMGKQPFLRPAWDAHKGDFLKVFAEACWRLLGRGIRAQGKK